MTSLDAAKPMFTEGPHSVSAISLISMGVFRDGAALAERVQRIADELHGYAADVCKRPVTGERVDSYQWFRSADSALKGGGPTFSSCTSDDPRCEFVALSVTIGVGQ